MPRNAAVFDGVNRAALSVPTWQIPLARITEACAQAVVQAVPDRRSLLISLKHPGRPAATLKPIATRLAILFPSADIAGWTAALKAAASAAPVRLGV